MNGKKILSLLLCMLMMVSLFPVSAFAEETETPKEITWALAEDGALTISGEGAMTNYDESVKQPWADKLASIKSIVIEEGVTSIGDNAFAGCSILESVTIADTVTTIGKSAFANTALTTVSIPYGITAIGENAFANCEKLETVNVPCNWDTKAIPETETEAEKPLYTFAEGVTVNKTVHDFTYTSKDELITASCGDESCKGEFTLTLIAPESLVYDGTEKTVTLENNIPNVADPEIKYNGDRANVTTEGFSASATIKVGEEELTASLGLKISPMAATITVPSASEISYGQPLSAATLSDGNWSWLDGTQIPAIGEDNVYTAVTKAENANYDYSALEGYDSETKTITRDIKVKVNKAAGSGSVTLADWNYGEAANSPVPSSDTNGTDNVSYEYKVKGAEDSSYTATVPIEVGEYTVKATFAETDSYTAAIATADFKILSVAPTTTDFSAATVTVSGDYTYTGSAISPGADKLTVSLNGQAIDITGFTIVCSNNVNAGEADISITPPEGSAYSGTATGKFTIKKAVATISRVTLREKTYDGTAAVQIDTMTVGGFNSSDNVSIDTFGITAVLPGSDVGTYNSVTVSGLKLTGGNKDNFTISESITLEGSYSIQPKTVTPTVELSADSFTYNGKEQKPAVTVKDGSAAISAAEYTLSFTDSTKAGTVTITVTDVANGNYTINGTTKTYTIKPAKLTIAPKAVSVTRSANAPALTYTVTGLVSGEKIAANTSLQFTLYNSSGTEVSPATAVKTAGTYTIKWTNMNSIVFGNIENYELSRVETANFVVTAPAGNAVVTTPAPTTKPSSTTKPATTMPPATTMQPAVTTKPSLTVPISGDKGAISVEANLVGSTAVISKVDTTELKGVVGDAAIVSVDFSKLSGNIHTAQLPTAMVNEMAKDQGGTETFVIVLNDETSIAFDSSALAQKSAQAKGKDITVSIKDSDSVSTLTKAQKEAISGKDAFDIKVTSGGKSISQLGGTITISAPYELRAGETAEGITVWYVDSEGNREACPTGYDSVSRRVTWQTDHLSLYMIDHEEQSIETSTQIPSATPAPTPTVVDSDSGSDLGVFLWIMLIALILMGVGGLVFVILRRRKEY